MFQHNERPQVTGWLRRHRVRTIAATVALAAIAVAAGTGFTECPQPTTPTPDVSVGVGPVDVSIGTGTSCGQCQPGLVGVTSMLCDAVPQGLFNGVAVNVPGVSINVGGSWSGCWTTASSAPPVGTTSAPTVAPQAPPATTATTAAPAVPAHHAHHRSHVSARADVNAGGYPCGCYYPGVPSSGAFVSVGGFMPSIQIGVSW